MSITVNKVSLQEILFLRNLFLQETNFQIRYNACHERSWTDSYIVLLNNEKIGYGSVKGNENLNDRDTVFEFYLVPFYRNLSFTAFTILLQLCKAKFIECQTNDLLLTTLLYQYGINIHSDVILLKEGFTSQLVQPALLFRKRNETDIIFEHRAEPVGNYVLELNNEVVATGGFLLHYNIPFADLYMEVKEEHRRKGLGSFLIQEIIKECYLSGRLPAARTGIDNIGSRATLLKAGLQVAGNMLIADVRTFNIK